MARHAHSERAHEPVDGCQPLLEVTGAQQLFGGLQLERPSLVAFGQRAGQKVGCGCIATPAGVGKRSSMRVVELSASGVRRGSELERPPVQPGGVIEGQCTPRARSCVDGIVERTLRTSSRVPMPRQGFRVGSLQRLFEGFGPVAMCALLLRESHLVDHGLAHAVVVRLDDGLALRWTCEDPALRLQRASFADHVGEF